MKKSSSRLSLTPKEDELMRLLWDSGPIPASRLVELYPEPHPHVNTVATVLKRLEAKGFVAHRNEGGTFYYYASSPKEDFRNRSLSDIVADYFGGSYFGAVSSLVEQEKISARELQELLDLVQNKKKE